LQIVANELLVMVMKVMDCWLKLILALALSFLSVNCQ